MTRSLDSRKYEPVSRDDCVRGLSLALSVVASPFFKGEGEGEGLILSRWQLLLTPTPHLHPLPFVRERRSIPPGRRRACPTTRLIAFCLRHINYSYVVPGGRAPRRRFPVLKLGRYPHSLAATSRLYLLFWKSLSSIPGFLIPSASVHVSAIAPSQVCQLEFRRRICAQYLPATGYSRAMPDSSGHNQRAFQNRDSSGA